MLNLCRSFREPCLCARSRFGWQMSNRATMSETWSPAENSKPFNCSKSYRGAPIKDRRSYGGQIVVRQDAGQNYSREYKKPELIQEYPEQFIQEYQEYGNYASQQSTLPYWEPCRSRGQQLPPPNQRCYGQPSSVSESCYEQQPPPQRRYEQQPPSPPKRCCEQQPPPPPKRCCCQDNSSMCYEQQPPSLTRSCYEPPSPPKRCCEQQPPPPPPKRCCCQDNSSSIRCEQQPPPPPKRCCCQDSSCSSCEQNPTPPMRCCCQDNSSSIRSEQQPPPPPKRCFCQESSCSSCEQQPPPQRCCCQDTSCSSCEQQPPLQWPPPQRCCCKDKPPCNCQEKDSDCRDKPWRKRRTGRRKKCFTCECECVVTHEAGVQTEAGPPCQPEPPPPPPPPPPLPDRVEIIDVTTQEKEIRHRSGEVEIVVDEILTTTVIPNDGSKPYKTQVTRRVASSNENDPPPEVQTTYEEIDPDSIVLPDQAAKYSELETIMDDLMDATGTPPAGASSPSEFKDRRVYRTNETFEKDTELSRGKMKAETILDEQDHERDSGQKEAPTIQQKPAYERNNRKKEPQKIQDEQDYEPSSEKRDSQTFPDEQDYERNSGKKEAQPIVDDQNYDRSSGSKKSAYFNDVDDYNYPVEDSPTLSASPASSPSHKRSAKRSPKGSPKTSSPSLSPKKKKKSNTNDSGVKKRASGYTPKNKMKEDSRKQRTKPKSLKNIKQDSQVKWTPSELSQVKKTPKNIRRDSKFVPKTRATPLSELKSYKNIKKNQKEFQSPQMAEDTEGKLVPKPRASDFSQVSTMHMKVTNRKEMLSQKAGRQSVHQDKVYETRISELRVLSPPSEEEEPEPEPKPKRKKPKKKKKVCGGYPPNDLVCRMHRPLRRQRCDPCRTACGVGCGAGCGAGSGAGCRNCCLPCFVPCSGSLYPPCVPNTTQCDPIYGFSSVPNAYYCHRQ